MSYAKIAEPIKIDIVGFEDRESWEWKDTTGIFGRPKKIKVKKVLRTPYSEKFEANMMNCRHNIKFITGFRVEKVTPYDVYEQMEIEARERGNIILTMRNTLYDAKFRVKTDLAESIKDTIYRLHVHKSNGALYYFYLINDTALYEAFERMKVPKYHYHDILEELKND